MKVKAPLIGIAVVVVVGVTYAFLTLKETKDATVHFDVDGQICRAKLNSNNRVVVKKNQKIKFRIQDECGITKGYTLDTQFVNWKSTSGPPCDDDPDGPLDGPAKGKKTFTRGIKNTCKDAMKFTFDIAVDGQVIDDPELEIAP